MSVTMNRRASRLTFPTGVMSFRKSLLLALLLALLVAVQMPAFASGLPNRIAMNTASSATLVKLTGTVHPGVHRGIDLGATDANKALDYMTLHILPSAAQKADLENLLAGQQDPTSPLYHQWLTQQEYGARFGLSDDDLAALSTWLASQGFSVREVSPSRNLISFSGNVGQAESAFHTSIHDFQIDGAVRHANVTDISLPKSISGVVGYVTGLHGFRPKGHLKPTNPEFTSHTSGNHFLSPGDWATIYNVTPIYTAGYTGTGMHVGIVGQTYIPQTDVDYFRSAAGLPSTLLTYKCITASTCTASTDESVGDVAEADIDVQWAGGIAKNATVDYVYTSAASTSEGVYDALVYAITTYTVSGSVVPVISMSYGSCETHLTGTAGNIAYRQSMDTYFAQAASQGQSLLNSSGDDGAAECDYGATTASHGLVVSWPASSPLYTGVGGTEFSGDGTDTYSDQYWTSSTTTDIISSALQYIPETSWNDTTSTSGLSATGGGVSLIYPLPTWQWAPSNYTGTSMRFSPDISFTASPDHDAYLVCTQNFTGKTVNTSTGSTCTNGFRNGSGYLTAYGGTSCSSPSFAGLLTLAVQAGGKLGNINKKLYTLAGNSSSYASIFHDITTGSNIVPCTTGSTNCTTGSLGYSATTGYDLVTGLGSANGLNLHNALTSTLSPSTTALQLSTGSVTLNGSITLTANVTSTVTGTPTGTVQFYVGNTSLGSPVTLDGSATATLSNVAVTTTNGFSAGTDSLTAVYSGDTTYATSTSSAQSLTVNGLTTTLTPSATTNPITIGQTETFTATLGTTAATGTVTFKIGNTTLGTGTVSNGVATLQIAASVANGFSAPSVTITMNYSGDSSYNAESNTLALTVNKASTTTALGTLTASTLGSSVTLSATVAGAYGGTPTGTVTFYANGNSLGNATLSSNTASLTVTASTASGFVLGSNSITATYNGDGNYNTSNSSTGTLALTAATTTSVSVGTNPIALGASKATESFTATVTSTSGTPTGTVTFSMTNPVNNVSFSLGTVTLVGGQATLSSIAPSSANDFAVGTDTVTATYNPATGSNFNTSNGSNTFTVGAPAYTIAPASTSVTLTPGSSSSVGVTLTSTTFAGSTSWTATPSSGLITVSPSSGTATLSAGGTATINLQITASNSASNRHPHLPWTIGGGLFAAMLAGLPLVRRRKRVAAILLTALAVASLAFALSCSSGSKAPRSYTVSIAGTGGISSTISVTVN